MGEWQREIESIHETAIKRSSILPWSKEDVRFLSLALAGEVGELGNFVKKEWRGDFQTWEQLETYRRNVGKELADIRVYLHLVATAFGVDLDEAVEEKLPEIRSKFLAKEIGRG